MNFISQLNSDLKFGLGGSSYIYVNTGNTGASTFANYENNPVRYLTVDSLNNRVIVPGNTPLTVTNATITNLTVTNFTGVNYVLTGPTGAAGSVGLQGFTGFQGLTGVQGNQGFQGAQGITGLSGIQGLRGLSGNQGFQGAQGSDGDSFTLSITNFSSNRILTSTTVSTGLNAEIDLTFTNNVLTVNNNMLATGLFINSITGIDSSTGLIDSNFSINVSHGSTGVYSIINLDNISANNGKETTLLNFYPATGIFININTVGGTTYATGTAEYSASFVFYDGSWIVSGKY